MLTSTPRITGNSGTPGSMTVGDPIILGTPNSVLIDDNSGNLGVSHPTIANTFLSWDGANFVWATSGSGNMAIGNPVTFGTAPGVLYMTTPNILANNATQFSFDPLLYAHIQISDFASFNTDFGLTPSSAGILTNDFNTGVANTLSLDNSRGVNLLSTLGFETAGFFALHGSNATMESDSGVGQPNTVVTTTPNEVEMYYKLSPFIGTPFIADIGIFGGASSGPQSTTTNIIIAQMANNIQLNHPNQIIAKVDDGTNFINTIDMNTGVPWLKMSTTNSVTTDFATWTLNPDSGAGIAGIVNDIGNNLSSQFSMNGAFAYFNATDGGNSISSTLQLDATQIDLRFVNALAQTSYIHGDNASMTVRLDDPSATAQSYSLYLPDSTTMRWRLTPANSANGIVSIDSNGSHTYLNYSDGTGSIGSLEASPTALTAQWTDSANLISNTVYSSSGALITASDTGTGFFSTALFDPNQFIIKWDNGAGITSRILGTLFGTTNVWSDSTAQAITSNGSTQITSQYTDGLGNTSQVIYNATEAETSFADLNGYTAIDHGDSTQTYQQFFTPYQIYSDENTTFQPGDTLTDDGGNTADVVSDDGNGLIIAVNVNIVSPPAFFAGATITDQNFNTANSIADGGVYGAQHGVSQNVTFGLPDRYAMFRNDITSSLVNDRYEIAHPNHIQLVSPSTKSSGILQFSTSLNNAYQQFFTNSSGGSNALTGSILFGDVSQLGLQTFSSGFTTSGLITASSSRMYASSGNLLVHTQNANSIIFATGGTATTDERMRLTTTGVAIHEKIEKYNNISTVSNGVPSEYATVDLIAQTAAIGATTAYAVPATGAGMYRVSWVATVTTAASVSSVLGGATGFQVRYTDADDSVVKTTDPAISSVNVSVLNTTATTISGVMVVFAKASTNLQYLFGYTSVGVTPMAYNLHVKVEAM